MSNKLFEYSHSHNNIDYYYPSNDVDIFIQSIDLETGEITDKRIVSYTIHKNLNMYKISSKTNQFTPFWVSDDHSLIVRDKLKESDFAQYIKISPLTILKDPDRYELVQFKDNKLTFIPIDKINIEYDPTKTTAADFTVEDNYTFSTSDGIFVQDTMSIFTPMSQEALNDTKKFLNPYNPSNPRSIKYEFSKDYVYAICLLLAKDFGDYSKPVKIKIGKDTYQTNLGRSYLFDCLDESDKNYTNFKILEKHDNITDIITNFLETMDIDHVKDFIDKVQVLCTKVMTENSTTITMEDMKIVDKLKPLINKYTSEKDLTKKTEIIKEINDEIVRLGELSENLKFMIKCKSGKLDQLVQLLGIKGLVQSPDGSIVSIDGNFANGLSKKEYFISGQGARTGIVSRT
ncbi:MAG: hypothetical protein ACPLX8_00945, partial [Nanopusillaceae archaeon]